MKKASLFLTMCASAFLLASCQSEDETLMDVSNAELKTRSIVSDGMSVEDGVLTFSDYDSYQKVFASLHGLKTEELMNWNQKSGYTSMLRQESFSPNRISEEIEEKEGELDPVRKTLYSNRGLLVIGDTIYKLLGDYIYKVPVDSKSLLVDIESDPDAYQDIRFKHTHVLKVVPSGNEMRAGIEYKDAIYQDKNESRTPLSYVADDRREHVKFVAEVYDDSHFYWLKVGFRGRAQKKKFLGIWGNTFNDEVKWGQGTAFVSLNQFAPVEVEIPRIENAKESYNTDKGLFKLAAEGQMTYCGVVGYFDCYKNDVSKEEHYKCQFTLT